ncbi:heptaprenyl diphosphate synthase component 1 [Neobacillus novalis]|uniref:Heptaprenyl diphosphate synthase component 1 n=1 Tax=Neobacillus novalis TaxID=220687 RepID=A0AA95S9N0_9BACI|nr:heptaprenyl diphosphate synthase component 1 [Neobacillus novalis]WHY84449.1 heptaprenyl diphosphate synthase component 1 [Neobacillus novalis]
MIRLPDIRQKFISIREQVEKKVFDSYLLEYIETPIIDEDKLLILISIMDRLELSFNQMQNYCLSTMLVQIALDTHEHITNTSEVEKERQLTVLAGDYFSGLYYKLLAESKDIKVIKNLAKGIKEVNEHKILVYQKQTGGIEKLMTSIMQIESSLFERLAEYFKVDLWNGILSNLLFFKRLLTEREQFIHTGNSFIFEVLKRDVYPKNELKLADISIELRDQLLMICDSYLDQSKQVIEKGIQQLPYLNDYLEKRISFLISQHQPIAKTFVEEG